MSLSEDLQKKLDKLIEYEDAYYNGAVLISDLKYDRLKDYVVSHLPSDHPYLGKVGHDPASSWPKEKHKIQMGSQSKVSNETDLLNWCRKVSKELGVKFPEFIVQHKIDGFSLECVYEGGELNRAVTRGNGFIGENITPNAKLFRRLPSYIPVDKEVAIRGEGVIAKRDFSILQEQTSDHYKNARNAASGTSRRLDGKHCRYVRLIAYDVNAKVKSESEKIQVLKKLGFEPVKTYVVNSEKQLIDLYRLYKNSNRKKLDYEIDGLVLKINDIDSQEKLGIKNNRPEGQIALKFDSDQATTIVDSIMLQVGRTGKITPVAILKPVELMGSTVTKATLHNFSEIERLMIGVGSEVTVEKKGDIIPQIVEVLNAAPTFYRPDRCPSCHGPLSDDSVNMWCRNSGCREREVNRIEYWAKQIDLKGFSVKFIQKLWDMNKIRNVADIYKLSPDDFTIIEGIGEKTVKSFFQKLTETSEMFLDRFITALGIPTCSISTATVLVGTFKTWDKIKTLEPTDIAKIPGFAETSANSICEGIAAVRDMADSLLKVIKIKEKQQGKLTEKSFCVTGSLSSMGRKQFGELVQEHGGTIKNSVVSGLTYLVTNDPNSGSSKNKTAKKYGVEIITEDQFFSLLGERKKEESKEEPDNEEPTIEYENIFEL